MGMEKAIKHGKEKRRSYRGSKSFDVSCRNHGGCGYCKGNRKIQSNRGKGEAQDKVDEYPHIDDLDAELQEFNDIISDDQNHEH